MAVAIIVLVIVAILTTRHLSTFRKIKSGLEAKTAAYEREALNIPEVKRDTLEDLEKGFTETGLGKYWDSLKTLARDEITVMTSPVKEGKLALGQSRIGGQPDLPQGVKWFKDGNGKSLSFLAQLNLAEIKPFDKEGLLPAEGILYFFYSAEQEAWGFDPKDAEHFKVHYYNGTPADLKRIDFPDDLQADSQFQTCALTFKNSISLPNWESGLVSGRFNDQEEDIYIELSSPEGEINKLFGYADNIQAPMEEECQLVTHGLYCGDATGYKDPRAKDLKKEAHQWRLLFQIDSVEDAGMMWGDVGRIFFWIRLDDLENKRFDKSWFVLQCS